SNQLDAATWRVATNLNGGYAALASNVVAGIGLTNSYITNAFITNSIFSGNGAGLTSLNAGQLVGTISTNNIAPGTIILGMFAGGSIGSNQLASGSVTSDTLADGAVTLAKLQSQGTFLASTIYTEPVPGSGYNFASSLAAVGSDRVVIGAPFDDRQIDNGGAAFLFNVNGTYLATCTNPVPSNDERLGSAAAAVGTDRILLAAYTRTVGGNAFVGAAYLFNTNGTLLTT